MGLKDLFSRQESLIAVDIGTTSLKVVEVDTSGAKPKVIRVAQEPFQGDVFSSNVIVQTGKVADSLSATLSAHGFEEKRMATAVPGPSVFTKKIKMPKMNLTELGSNIQFEAGNFIPHNINAVRLDFHVVGESAKNQLDVLVVAVKNEIIDSFTESISLSGHEAAVVDVDFFALQNVFEVNYPEHVDKTVALVNIGARFTSINICRGGQSLFTGDMSLGGRAFTEALADGLTVAFDEAEKLKRKLDTNNPNYHDAVDILKRSAEDAAQDLNRQLSFLWSASGADDAIDMIVLSGGGALLPGLLDELKEKTGLPCSFLDPVKEMDLSGVDAASVRGMGAQLAIALGLGLRQPGDRIIPEYEA